MCDPHGAARASAFVCRAVKAGKLKRPTEFTCADCGRPATRYDHRDYNAPLVVEPVCATCNQLRGPAIPRKGFFQKAFEEGHVDIYGSRKRMKQLLDAIGIESDLSAYPGRIKYKHWLPFKAQLLEWESTR